MVRPRPMISIGVITRQRPEGLRRLLESLKSLEFTIDPAPTLSVVVVDNDANGSAKPICDAIDITPWPLLYIVEKRLGIPYARNAVLRESRNNCDFIAFVDDDEVVGPTWLAELLDAQRRSQADVVAGPVLPRFVDSPPKWVVEGGFFDRPRYTTGDRLRHVATGNVLVRSDSINKADMWFDNRFALTGGSDTHFFMRLASTGAVMVWSDEAVVHESIPASRLRMRWLLQRAYRGGNTLALCEVALGASYSAKLIRMAKGCARIVQGVTRAVMSLGRQPMLTDGLLKLFLGAGMISGVFGLRYEEYKKIHSA